MIYQTLNFFTDNNVKENKRGLQHETDKRIFYLRKTGCSSASTEKLRQFLHLFLLVITISQWLSILCSVVRVHKHPAPNKISFCIHQKIN